MNRRAFCSLAPLVLLRESAADLSDVKRVFAEHRIDKVGSDVYVVTPVPGTGRRLRIYVGAFVRRVLLIDGDYVGQTRGRVTASELRRAERWARGE